MIHWVWLPLVFALGAIFGPLLTRRLTHHYLSTACYHGHHRECQTNATRYDGTPKIAGQCKYCPARCSCRCHKTTLTVSATDPTISKGT